MGEYSHWCGKMSFPEKYVLCLWSEQLFTLRKIMIICLNVDCATLGPEKIM